MSRLALCSNDEEVVCNVIDAVLFGVVDGGGGGGVAVRRMELPDGGGGGAALLFFDLISGDV